MESGTDGLRKTTLSLRELVEQVAHDAEYETPGRGCRVTTPAADEADEFLVEADPDLLRSAVENAVRNATRYTAEGTTVEVRLERQQAANGEKEIIVRVLDSGPGVPDEALPKIFEPFIDWTMPVTARPEARVWACRLRTGPSGYMAVNFVHPTAKRVGYRWKSGFRLVLLFRGLLFPLIPDKQICFSHKRQSP